MNDLAEVAKRTPMSQQQSDQLRMQECTACLMWGENPAWYARMVTPKMSFSEAWDRCSEAMKIEKAKRQAHYERQT